MSQQIGSLHYDIDIDDKKLSKQLDHADSRLKGFASGMADVGKKIAIGMAAATAGAVAFGVSSVKAFTEAQDVMAQTNNVIKSTGGVAGMSAEHVSNLASALQSVTRFSDETIQSGENLLLTFTGIGKDIFPQATETMLDMSQALGQDVKSSAIQLGKALNDPIIGVTALRKVGVSFTQAQQDQIKVLVESGKKLEAQKLILKELQVEFGGSAKAAGQTFAGQLDILKNKFGDVQEQVGAVIVKALTPFAIKLMDVVSNINWEGVINTTIAALQRFWSILLTVGKAIFDVARQIADYLSPKLQALFNTVQTEVLPVLLRLWHEAIEPLLPVIGTLFVMAVGGAIDALNLLLNIVTPVVAFFMQNKDFLLPIILAFGALKVAMMFEAAFNAITLGFNTLKLITIPSAIASLQTLQNTLTGFTGWGIFAGVAISAFQRIMQAIDQLEAEIDNANAALSNSTKYQDDFYRSLRRAREEGRITEEEFKRRNAAFGQSSQMPQRALGGPVRAGQPTIVGERGPEIYVPGRNGTIIPNDKIGGQMTINIGTIEDRQDADYILRRLDRSFETVRMGLSP